MICRVAGVSYRYRGRGTPALDGVSLDVAAGTHVMVVGPNGAGKSTLLRLIAGVLRPAAGTVEVFGGAVASRGRRELARHMAVVAQSPEPAVPITVRELVELGRSPYLKPWQPLSRRDRDLVEASLEWTDLTALADRDVRALSGGELQRARLARAFAQRPSLLLLDEPTAHLDLGHEMRLLELVAEWIASQTLTVISVTHHLNVAARFSDRLVLLRDGSIVGQGSAEEVMTPERLGAAFEWPVAVRDLGNLGRQAIPLRRERPGMAE